MRNRITKLAIRSTALAAAVVTLVVPALASTPDNGGPIFLSRHTVIPVDIENDLTVRQAHEGDRFTAHVDNDLNLPFHTRLIGRVWRIRTGRSGTVADLEFTDVILPDGSRHRLEAVPVSLDDRYVRHMPDGRIVTRDDPNRGAADVVGGAAAGYIIGSTVHRRFTGAIIGAIIGSIAAHNDRTGDHLLSKGQLVGALIERDTTLDSYPGPGLRPGPGRDRDAGRPPVREDDGRDAPPVEAPPAQGPPAELPHNFTMSFEGKAIRFDETAHPYQDGEAIMVPLQRLANQMKLSVERGHDTVIYVEGPDSSARLELNSPEARLNGRKVQLPGIVIDRDGVLYVPVEVLASMVKGSLTVNGAKIKPLTPEGE